MVEFNTELLEKLCESLDTDESAKDLFRKEFLREAAVGSNNGNAKKAKSLHGVLAWLNKGTPTVESSSQKILEALTGMERIIETSPLATDARRQRDLRYLAKYKEQLSKATTDIINANKKYDEAKARFHPEQMKALEAQLQKEEEQHMLLLEQFEKRAETAQQQGNKDELIKVQSEVNDEIEKIKQANPDNPDATMDLEEIQTSIENCIKMLDDALKNDEAKPGNEDQQETAEAGKAGQGTETNPEEHAENQGDVKPDETKPEDKPAQSENGTEAKPETENPEAK